MEQLSKKVFLGNNTGNFIVDYNIKKYIIDYLKKYKHIFNQPKELDSLLDLHYIKNNSYVFIPYFGMNSYYLLFICQGTYYLSVLIEKDNLIDIDNINYNKLKIFHVRLRGNKKLYNGTLFLGNLMRIDNKSIFLIKNIYIEQNKLISENYLSKIKIIDNILNEIKTDKVFDTFELKVIRYYKIIKKDLDEFKNKLPNTKLPIEGIHFINIDQSKMDYYNMTNINTNDNKSLYTFQVKKLNVPDVYELYCEKNNITIKYGIACILSLEKSRNIANLFNNIDTLLMDCQYNKKFNKWEPIKITTNNISKFEDIIQYIKQTI
jgi:hypothetical protein